MIDSVPYGTSISQVSDQKLKSTLRTSVVK